MPGAPDLDRSDPGPADLVLVTVGSRTRRVDLLLPGAVPVAELLPELTRSLGLLDARTVHGGYRLVTAGGRVLADDRGLAGQGVADGGLLTVAAGTDEKPPRIYDDVVEAMADAVERDLVPWHPDTGRRAALAAAGTLTTLGAVALLLQRGSPLATAGAAGAAAVLVAGAVLLSRVRRDAEAALAFAWAGTAYAAVVGPLPVTGGDPLGLPLALAGAGALTAGAVALLGLDEGRTRMVPAVLGGAVALAAGLAVALTEVRAAVVLTVALVLVVLAGSLAPPLALGVTGAAAERPVIDPDRVRADARVAHEVLVAISATTGLLLVLVVPWTVRLGAAGTALAVAASCVVLLRSRQHRSRAAALVGTVTGVLGLVSTAVAVLTWWPAWRPAAAVVPAVAGAVLLVATVARARPARPSVRRARLGDLAETLSVLALLPLLVVATGVPSSVGW